MKQHLILPTLFSILLMAAVPVSAGQKLSDSLTLNAALEVDIFSLRQDVSGDSADILVSTLEIGLDANIGEGLDTSLVFLYEDGFSGLEVDQAIMILALGPNMSLNAGKMTLPFGRFDSAMLSDPLTLELGESADTAVQLGMSSGAISGSLTLFNGDIEEAATTDDDQFRFLLAIDFSSANLDAGMSWISSLDSDTLAGLAPTRDVAGFAVYATWRSGAITLSAEHVSALDDYVAGDFSTVATPSQPSASAVELAYALDDVASVAIAVQQSSEAAFAGLKEQAVLIGYSRSLESNLDIGLEISNGEDYSVANGGQGDDSSQILLRLSAAF